MQILVVMPKLESEAVGMAPRLPRLLCGQIAPWERYPKVAPAGRRRVGCPGYFDLRLFRKRARGAGQRLAKSVEGCLVGHAVGMLCPVFSQSARKEATPFSVRT